MRLAVLVGLCSAAVVLFLTSATSAFAQVVVPTWNNLSGAVKLSWGFRGGSCQVRYTEVSESVYKYQTVAGCDDGGVVVGGLVPGQRYKFQVSQDRMNWTRAVTTKAQSWMTVSATSQTQEVINGDGAVRLVWGLRGGTCYVRYTEANQRVYKYWTQTGCDDGQIVIGSLVTGRKYRFQISQNLMGWSRPLVVRAKSVTVVTPFVAPMVVSAVASSPVVATPTAVAGLPGSVRLVWGLRGGVCNVRYTESGSPVYQYATSASCNDGGVTIGSLVSGQVYKFVVAQDNWSSWSRPVRARAQ